MTINKSIFSFYARPLLGLFILSLLFAACKKNDNDLPNQPVAGLMAYNLAPDKAPVGFAISGNRFGNSPLYFSNYTGAYLPVYSGSRELASFDYNSGTTIATNTATLADSMYYSVFLVGARGSYRNVFVKDELAPLTRTAGKAWVRYINAIPDSTAPLAVSIADGGFAEQSAYANVSAFKQVNAGSSNTTISNGSTISATRNIDFEEDKVYTILFVGLPNQTEPTQAVQIKFVQNGVIRD